MRCMSFVLTLQSYYACQGFAIKYDLNIDFIIIYNKLSY